jgi:glycine/D-amino acid oxidase-like deaminating enzyme/nitrite reductase/ring-hydroxylating ferredoxin subunit
MNVSDERSRSLWMETAIIPDAPPLRRDETTDVVIVGSGIAGLTSAYNLVRAGKSVIVLDRGALAGGMTSRTSAHLTSTLDDLYHELISLRGLNDAKLCYASQQEAISFIEKVQAKEAIDCDFRRLDGYLFNAPGTDKEMLNREIDACHEVGFDDVAFSDQAPLPGLKTGRCLRFPRQGRFHPRKYLAGLVKATIAKGGRIHGHTPVRSLEETHEGVLVKTETGHTLRAAAAIVATNSPINDRVAIHAKQAPYRTYVIAGAVPKGAVTDALFWDTADPYHYVRLQPGEDRDMLIVGGEDHKSGEANDAEERFDFLVSWAELHFPQFEKLEHRWSGQVMDPIDFLPFIGRNPGNQHIFVATGDSGQGLTNGTVAGLVIPDLILGRDHPWAKLYDPGRVTVGAAGRFAQENLTMLASLTEYVTGGERASADELKPGEGAIIRQGMSKLAAFRDDHGELHVHSAICTHMGCLLKWNSFEQCWDCPCHGSQFAPDGQVLNGPAVAPLSPADATQRQKGAKAATE